MRLIRIIQNAVKRGKKSGFPLIFFILIIIHHHHQFIVRYIGHSLYDISISYLIISNLNDFSYLTYAHSLHILFILSSKKYLHILHKFKVYFLLLRAAQKKWKMFIMSSYSWSWKHCIYFDHWLLHWSNMYLDLKLL